METKSNGYLQKERANIGTVVSIATVQWSCLNINTIVYHMQGEDQLLSIKSLYAEISSDMEDKSLLCFKLMRI